MGIVNVTPDSFHANSRTPRINEAIAQGLAYFGEGADWVDVGGESTRPNAEPLDIAEEFSRVIPVIEGLIQEVPDGLISIDTRHPEVAKAGIVAGAKMVNDVSGLRNPKMFEFVLEEGVPVCIMHMKGEPQTMQNNPVYGNVVDEVSSDLIMKAEELIGRGYDPSLILLDPGIGFGKNVGHNISLLKGLEKLEGCGRFGVMLGASRKSLVGELIGRDGTDERLVGTLAISAFAQLKGVDVLRVHDVAEHRDLAVVLSHLS